MEERLSIQMVVNGQAAVGEVEARTLLAYFLRDHLGLTGTHIGCDTSQCGACTVLMDGVPVKSCTVLAVQADQSHITTVEGLASEAGPHVVQRAFQEAHGLQCGFCTPGVMMVSRWIVEQHPEADDREIRELLDGVICRCTGYENIVRAVARAQKLAVESETPAAVSREVSS
ncbi:(2Fe-2S)-binding protein [Sulfobacillus harzensis]|uniref:(2Fe-2S)-binding protein n=1 Tax=Sulfobacillus harzensis TaxID=2729629 RepID=A0A7Y0L517_9FIRM|nr:(2Fe-2S)-binding protein [Sulfobacillus harzensis]NMP23406.1 (2Fe-2S)-binding protein [Sulfobacillus harzensis]